MKVDVTNLFDKVGIAGQDGVQKNRASSDEKQTASKKDSASSFASALNSKNKDVKPKELKSKETTANDIKPRLDSKAEKQTDKEEVPQDKAEQQSASWPKKPMPNKELHVAPKTNPLQSKPVADSEQEVRAEDVKTTTPVLDKEVAADQLTRRVALQTFLKKMKEQLDVDPPQLMQAFSSLSIEELTRPPEENVEKIIQGLGISQEEKPVARQLFAEMMKDSAANSMAEYLKASGQNMSLEVMSQKEIRQQAIDNSLRSMNQDFFLAKQKPMLQNQAYLKYQQQVQAQNQQQPQAFDENGQLIPQKLNNKDMVLPPFIMPNNQAMAAEGAVPIANMQPMVMPENMPVDAAKVQPQAAQAVPTEAVVEASQTEVAATPLTASTAVSPEFLSKIMPKAQNNNSVFGSDDDEDQTDYSELDAIPELSTEIKAEDLQGLKSVRVEGKQEADAELMDQDLSANLQQPQAQTKLSKMAPAAGFAANLKPTETQHSSNVKELINQAQIMIKRGGGEMKVILQPEGLGEVAMKIDVKNGQVNVEMMTETNEAKKLIEKGLGELKATLASHKLNVDQIKVDLAQDVAKNYQQQHDQAQKHYAQQFMEEFRRDNQEWRQGFYDIPGARGAKSQTKDEAENSYLTPQSSSRSGSSRRLNLVA